jgi:biopolymer transport protein ExbD
LIFFLMTTELSPPEPFPVAPPEAQGQRADPAPFVFFLDADGQAGFGDQQGDAAFRALELARIAACADGGCKGAQVPPLQLRADGAAEARRVAGVVTRLAGMGFGLVSLITVAP